MITLTTLRERATAAVRDLQETGALTDVDGVQVATDAVLTEVQSWLRERSETYDNPFARAALRIAARAVGPDEGRD